MRNIDLFKDYENAKISYADKYAADHPQCTVLYDELGQTEIDGIPIVVRRNESGRLEATFISDTHVLAIGATRSGKTTGYVIPTLNVLLNKKNKPSIVISDPKQELYIGNAEKFKKQGYKVILLDFTNYKHSDCWNPLTKYYRYYQEYLRVEQDVKTVNTQNGVKYKFRGSTYSSKQELDMAICEVKDGFIVSYYHSDGTDHTLSSEKITKVLFSELEEN